ncbi:MAG: autotransporter-associated beta strand repeat-containing protein, partial [Methylacidiphilales bacterium]|nr:autotransporter-associated beta strand repeat-containing protein [Candidatus Methylacidiphilales bacterium]
SAGLLNLSNALALQNSTLAANSAFTNSGIIFSSTVSGNAFTLGGLTGSGNLALQNNASTPAAITLSVGNNGSSTTYSGVLSGPGSLVKVGAGTLILTGFNTYAGSTTISGGTLRLKAPPILPTGLKIMPVGDSITFGYNGTNAGYRGPLYNLLKNIAPGLLYVGSSVQGNVTVTGPQMLPLDQRHNEGHSSYTISDINNNLDGLDLTEFNIYGGAERDPNGGHWLDGVADTNSPNYRLPLYPDIITLMIGTNNTNDTDRAAVQTQLHALITKITTMRPNTKLIVAQITPSTRPNVVSYNAAVASEVASFQAAGKQVSMVDLYTNFPTGGLTGDGIHPNDTGFNFMANQWYNGILAVVTPVGKGVSSSLPTTSPVAIAGGATLDLDGAQAAVCQISGSGTLMLGSGGILTAVNTAGNDTTFSGPISGSGNLIKTGTGTWTLTGSCNYTGTTQISGGVLNLSGTLANNSTFDVFSGATLNLAGGTITTNSIHIHSGGALSGTGTINATIINDNSPYNAWKNLKFSSSDLADPAISGDTADPNRDGIPNLLAYALHLEPKNPNTGGFPVAGETNAGGNNYLTLNYTQLNWVTEINYLVEVSSDLATWNSGPPYTALVSSLDNGDGTSTVVAQDLTPMNAATKRFIRLRITKL